MGHSTQALHSVNGQQSRTSPSGRSNAGSPTAGAGSLHSIGEEHDAVESNAANKQAAGKRASTKSGHVSRPSSAAATKRQSKGTLHSVDATAVGSVPMTHQGEAAAEAAATIGAAAGGSADRARPFSAQLQARAPGIFLRQARPQSAAAANVASYARPRSPNAGVQNFNEPKQESGWVDFRAQSRRVSDVCVSLKLCPDCPCM